MPKIRKLADKLGRRQKSTNASRGPHAKAAAASLADSIIETMRERADAKSKAWFTNYVKGSEWIGCKTPVVRSAVKDSIQERKVTQSQQFMDNSIALLQHPASDVKLAGMVVLSEFYPLLELASMDTLERLDRDLWDHRVDCINDWSTADWLSMRVLAKIVFCKSHQDPEIRNQLQQKVLGYAKLPNASLWHRRCGIVSFLNYHKHRSILPADFGSQLVQACETNLLQSPQERFTQTGIAWVLRYVLMKQNDQGTDDSNLAYQFILRHHGSIWTTESKKSFCEKLSQSDGRRKRILDLSS